MKSRKGQMRYRGTALVEASLVLLVLVLVTLGAFQYGWLFVCAQRVTNAARQGARMESVLDAPAGVAKTTMLGMVADLSPTGGSDITPGPGGDVVTATLIVPAEGNPKVQLITWNLLPVPATLQATVVMAKEGL
jgi:TadE-like protein